MIKVAYIKGVQVLAELEELNIYHLQFLKEKGTYYSNIVSFPFLWREVSLFLLP